MELDRPQKRYADWEWKMIDLGVNARLAQPLIRGVNLNQLLALSETQLFIFLKHPPQSFFIGLNVSDNKIYFPIQDICETKRGEDVLNN